MLRWVWGGDGDGVGGVEFVNVRWHMRTKLMLPS